jgi:hypothetical protein
MQRVAKGSAPSRPSAISLPQASQVERAIHLPQLIARLIAERLLHLAVLELGGLLREVRRQRLVAVA